MSRHLCQTPLKRWSQDLTHQQDIGKHATMAWELRIREEEAVETIWEKYYKTVKKEKAASPCRVKFYLRLVLFNILILVQYIVFGKQFALFSFGLDPTVNTEGPPDPGRNSYLECKVFKI